jgi:predicted CopG family antitoxin
MAVKTITIDLEAYGLLAFHKEAGQSFSQVIKAHFGRQPTAKDFRALVRKVGAGRDMLDSVEAQIARRRKEPARAIKL